MDRDELVERVAEKIGAKYAASPCVMTKAEATDLARAALAIIEPAVREECALIADEACDPYGADDGFSARAIATAIRAGTKP